MYDHALVATSIAIAVLSAFVALSISGRMVVAGSGTERAAWALGGAICMGGGIWSMHFVGMLAFRLPCSVGYDATGTLLSMIPGALASGVALYTISRRNAPQLWRLALGALLMGGGIGAMHYSGMAAMRPAAQLLYDPALVAISVVVAVLLAFLSLGVQFRVGNIRLTGRSATAVAATIMGFAIAGMHYTAMEAALFFPIMIADPAADLNLAPELLALVIAIITVLIAAIALAATYAGRQFELVSRLSQEVDRRTAVEAEAREGRARLQAIVDSVADAVITIDRSGRIRQWNSGAETIFGYTAAEAIGSDVTRLMPEPFHSQHAGYVSAFLRTRRPKIIGIGREVMARRKNGETFMIDLSVTEVQGVADVLFTGIVRDITERKRAEQDLIEARHQAEAASEAKSAFLATMSHEIRTPMHGVLGIANLLTSTPLNDRQRHLVDNLIRSGQVLTTVINDVLDFSKIEAGHIELFDVEFDLRELTSEIAVLFTEQCSTKGLEFIYFIDEAVPATLRGDPVRLRQVLVNLVGNAIKFTERGEVLVELSVAESGADHEVLSFEVSDTGIGIAEEHHATVFDSFQQIDGSMTRSRGGTGLGLAISKQLVELMGGTIGFESEAGRGSQFRFTARFKRPATQSAQPQQPRHLSRHLVALLVDTNRVSACVFKRYLRTWGLDTTVAASVEEAGEILDRGAHFDVAILDLKSLGAPVVDLATRMRSRPTPERAEIIFLAGLDNAMLADDLDPSGQHITLSKPVRPSDLFDALAAVAAGSPSPKLSNWLSRVGSAGQKRQFDAHVLLVEDNPVNQDVAEAVLENLGCRVFTVPNGRAAVDAFGTGPFDLILMDCEMPEMDGFEAARQIRRRERETGTASPIPIIAVTAHALPEMRDKCLAAGMNDFVVKPYDEPQLAAAMQRWVAPLATSTSRTSDNGGGPDPRKAAPSAIDLSVIDRIRTMETGGRAGLLAGIVAKFAARAPEKAGEIRTSCEAGDGETLWRAAHDLKSSSSTIGAHTLAERCQEIEAAARRTGPDTVRSMLEGLDADVREAVDALQALIAETNELVD